MAATMAGSVTGLFVGLAVAEAGSGFDTWESWLPLGIGIGLGLLMGFGMLTEGMARLFALVIKSIAHFVVAGTLLGLVVGTVALLTCYVGGFNLGWTTAIAALGMSVVCGGVVSAATLITDGLSAR